MDEMIKKSILPFACHQGRLTAITAAVVARDSAHNNLIALGFHLTPSHLSRTPPGCMGARIMAACGGDHSFLIICFITAAWLAIWDLALLACISASVQVCYKTYMEVVAKPIRNLSKSLQREEYRGPADCPLDWRG